MPNNIYRDLQLEGLYEILASAVKEMLAAIDSGEDNGAAYKAKRKQVDLLLAEIEKKLSVNHVASDI